MIGAVALLLLFVGIHNAWDTVPYIIVSQRKKSSDTHRLELSDLSVAPALRGTEPLAP